MSATTASVVISSYEYARFLRRCIDSALQQTVPAEVIVVDDASTDDSPDIIGSYGTQIVPILRERNGGQAAALNDGIAVATGDVIMFLDADDWIEARRVERVLEVFDRHGTVRAVRHYASLVDEDGRPLADRAISPADSDDPRRQLELYGNYEVSTGTVALARSLLDELGPIPVEPYRRNADGFITLGAALAPGLETIEDRLTVRRQHDRSITSSYSTDATKTQHVLEFRRTAARDAALIARRFDAPSPVADGATWWQLKAEFEYRKGTVGAGRWQRPWWSHLVATVRSELPRRRLAAELGRSIVLGLTPRRWFTRVWWRTHFARPRTFTARRPTSRRG